MGEKSGWAIGGIENSEEAWDLPYERRACGAEAASLSIDTLLGWPRTLCGGILSTKTDNYLKLKLRNIVHEINNLYPLDFYKNERNTFKMVSFDTNKIVTSWLGVEHVAYVGIKTHLKNRYLTI